MLFVCLSGLSPMPLTGLPSFDLSPVPTVVLVAPLIMALISLGHAVTLHTGLADCPLPTIDTFAILQNERQL